MVQIAYRNRESTSYPKINHVFVSSKAVFTAGALSSQYQAAITLCKQIYVDTQNTIMIHSIEINPLATNLDVSVCSGANNKAQIKVKTHRLPCRFSLLSIQWYAISGFDDRRWLRLSHIGSDVGQIFPTASLHRDHSISYALVCEKEISPTFGHVR